MTTTTEAAAERLRRWNAGDIATYPCEGVLQKLRPLVWGKGEFWQCVATTGLQDPAGDPRGLRYYVDHRGDQFMCWIGMATKCYPCDSIDQGKRLCEADYQSRVRALFEE